MSKKALYAVLLTTGLVAAGGLAMAAEPYLPKAQKSFDRIDLNKDGKISLAEFMPVAEKRFLGMDVNKDNAISTAEIDASLQAALEAGATAFWQISMPTRTAASAAPNSTATLRPW